MSQFLTAEEAAAYLRMSRSNFYSYLSRMRDRGTPVTTYRRRGRLLFTAADLDASLTVERAVTTTALRAVKR